MKTIYLKQETSIGGIRTYYVVTKLVGDISYEIGAHLRKDTVQELCEQTGIWKVVIT